MPIWAIWLVCLGFLLLRAILAAADAALYGTSDLTAKELSLTHPRRGGRVLRLKTQRESTAATLRLATTLFGFCAAALGTLVPPRLLDFSRYGEHPYTGALTLLAGAMFVGLLAATLDVTFRAMAIASPTSWALATSGFVSISKALLYPVLRVVATGLSVVVSPFGGKVRFESPPPPLEELQKLIAAQAASEGLDKDAPQLIRSIFELSDKRCRDVMVPRTEVVTMDIATETSELLRVLAEENHSRLPVYKDDPDIIVGTLHARDLIPLLQHPELIKLPDVIRPAHFVPWVKPIGDLLREMQKKRIHMAMVVDEYGSFMGIVTLEDILREIVGDIGDEFEVQEKEFEKLPDGSVMVRASVEIAAFQKQFGVQVPEGEYDTLGGFLSSIAGAIPDVGEKFTSLGLQFTVYAKEGARLERIRVVKPKSLKNQDAAALARGTG